MLLAGEEAGIRRGFVLRKREQERDLHGRAVGALAFAREVEHVEVADSAARNASASACAPLPLQHQHRRPSPFARKSRVNAPKESERGRGGGIRSISSASSSMNTPGNCTMRLCVPQGWRLRAPTVKPTARRPRPLHQRRAPHARYGQVARHLPAPFGLIYPASTNRRTRHEATD